MNFSSTYPSSDLWYAVHCKPGKEAYVANILQNNLGLFVFLPKMLIRQRGEVRPMPFFPGYLFVQVDLQTAPFSCINTTPGVLQVVAFGGTPAPLPYSLLEDISAKLDLLNIGNYSSLYHFSPGDLVKFKKRSLYALEMAFIGPATSNNRAQVLLQFLGHVREIKVDPGTLEKTAVASRYRQGRHVTDSA